MIKWLFFMTDKKRRRFGVALWAGILSGIIGAFVKWGAEVPFPPRTLHGGLLSRDTLNPPFIFLRDYTGIDPNSIIYTFSEHVINPVMIMHIIFSLSFAIIYCLIAEVFPRIKLWQGIAMGLVVTIIVHGIFIPAFGMSPPLTQIPFDEYFSEIFGHCAWFWAIEMIRRNVRNLITKEPDAEVPLNQPCR